MTIRKVTAAEEKVLTLAVEWAEKREAWEKESRSVPFGGALTATAMALSDIEEQALRQTRDAAKRLLKQRRAKGAHK